MITRIAAPWVALGLAACAALPEAPLPRLQSVPAAFEMTGRIAVREGTRSEIAQLRWTRTRAGDVWVISSPLGNEVARIESTARGATLTQAGAPEQHAGSFPELTEKLLGVALDPDWLAAGLHGQPVRGAPEGWKFTVEQTQSEGAVKLARRMSASRGEVVVRLVVDGYRPLED
jgi:outer membrane biogenesis lipoprotein LolB